MRHFRIGAAYAGAFDALATPPPGAVEVPGPPLSAAATWNGSAWIEPAAGPHRVLRGTIVDRLIAAGLDGAAEAVLVAAGDQVRRRWESRWWVWSNDPDAIAILTAAGANVAAVLARDPDAP